MCVCVCTCMHVSLCMFVSVYLCGILVSYYNNTTMVTPSFFNLEISFVENIKTGLHIYYPYVIKSPMIKYM